MKKWWYEFLWGKGSYEKNIAEEAKKNKADIEHISYMILTGHEYKEISHIYHPLLGNIPQYGWIKKGE